MLKRMMIRFINGYCCSIGITLIIQAVVLAVGKTPMLPEYAARFNDPVSAFASQLILIGVMSGITSLGTVVFEAKKIGLLAQSILYLAIMLSAWIPVACIAWGFHKYITSMIATLCSIVVSYGICWGILYKLSRKDIEEINAKLMEKKGQ